LRKKLAQPQDENGEELATTRKKLKAMSKKCKRLTKEKANSSVSLSCNYIAMSQLIELQEKLRKKDETVGGLGVEQVSFSIYVFVHLSSAMLPSFC
jgi:hypothetical protein